jgi:molybdopterin-containing oxidoreductase family iron-sulfur binding subunit
MGRGYYQRNLLEIFNTKDAKVWNEVPMVSLDHAEVEATKVDLWESFDRSVDIILIYQLI